MKALKTLGFIGFVFAAVLFLGAAKEVSAQQSSMEWTGSIDDRANLMIRHRNVRVVTITGRRNGNGRANFDGDYGMGDRRRGRANVDRLDGRGSVRVVQQPNRGNNFTTIIRIEDLKGGADRYRIRVEWN